MKSRKAYSLQDNNSFFIDTVCSEIYFPTSLDDLSALPDLSTQPFYILGDGSNTLFIDEQAPIIIKPNFTGITVTENDSAFILEVGASENWHDLVTYCVEQGMSGLENLVLIPGSVGAAPVQNIGAYGVELADYCQSVTWYDFNTQRLVVLDKQACQFSYRDSVFKQALYNKGLIISIKLYLPKYWQATLNYQGLDALPENVTSKQVMDTVIVMRQAKLPEPKVLPNAGSFFKNPLVSLSVLRQLQRQYNNVPYYQQSSDQVKLAAAWLIEQSGLKGYRQSGVGVHDNQALVLINYQQATGRQVLGLAKYVQACVKEKFNILLQPEVKMVTVQGEKIFDDLDDLCLKQ